MSKNGMLPGQEPYSPVELAKVESLVGDAARSDPGEEHEFEYEGWPNRATWNAVLWLNNDEPNYRAMRAFLRACPVRVTDVMARRFCWSLFGSRTPDGYYLARVRCRTLLTR